MKFIDANKNQARGQYFGGEAARVTAPKLFRGVTPGNFLKKVPAIWCIYCMKIINFDNFKVLFFTVFIFKNICNCIQTNWKLQLTIICC